jgi:hypothetical protein
MQRREFDLLVPNRHVRMGVRPATHDELPSIFTFAKGEIPRLAAGICQVERVLEHNQENILVFERDGVVVGIYAMLLLSGEGLSQLLLGTLDRGNPDLASLVPAGAAPSAIYNWAVVAPRLAAEGFRHASVYLRRPRFRNANIYARGTTQRACRIMEHTGYELVGDGFAELYRYVRLPNRRTERLHAA